MHVAGFELKIPRVTIGTADHSATQIFVKLKKLKYLYRMLIRIITRIN